MKQSANTKTKNIVYLIAIFFLGVFIMYGIVYKFPSVFRETVTKIEKDVTVTDEGIADAVEKIYDSTVIITTYKEQTPYSSGSGFIYKKDDKKMYIITNYHVIASGTSFKVTYSDETEVEAKLVNGDQYSDIAVLEVKTKDDMETAKIGNSAKLRVGDTTFTVGAPLDNTYSWTVTRGIISGKERMVELSLDKSSSSDFIMKVLQTDAAVNVGNSGGPLCNANGEVVGVVNAKISSSGVEGIGFAIPIEDASLTADDIIAGKVKEYPYIGISMYNVSDISRYSQYKAYISEDLKEGVLIVEAVNDSAAAAAGLKTGDIITELNGKRIKNIAYLKYELYKYKIGDTVKLTIIRDEKELLVNLKLASKLPTT